MNSPRSFAAAALLLLLASCASPSRYRETPVPLSDPRVIDLDRRICAERGRDLVIEDGVARCTERRP